MFNEKTAAASVAFAVLLLVFLPKEVKPQPKFDSFEGESCSHSEEDCRILIAENDQVKEEPEQLLAKTLPRQPVAINLIQTLDCRSNAIGANVMLDKIYVLCSNPNLIKVFENRNQFKLLTEIALNEAKFPCDIVYSSETKCFYIGDIDEECIWRMMTTSDYSLTKWLATANYLRTVSLSTDGQLLKLTSGEPFSQLIIYDWNANVMRSVQLPQDMKDPAHAVQTSNGNFILSHRLNDAANGIWVISQVNNVGQLIHRFIPSNQLERLDHPMHLSLDSENSRLFVADTYNHRVIVFDSCSLIWSQVLLSSKINGIAYPNRLFYDASQKRLMVAQTYGEVNIYELGKK